MKKLILLAITVLFLLIQINVQAQEFKIFNNSGDIGITTLDDKGFVVVDVDGSAQDLYGKTKMYVNELMVNPEFAIVADEDGKFLKWRSLGDVYWHDIMDRHGNIEYLTSISFKDNRIKVEYYIQKIYMRDMVIYYTGGGLKWGVYKKNGKMTSYGLALKNGIEGFFNDSVKDLQNFLSQEQVDDW